MILKQLSFLSDIFKDLEDGYCIYAADIVKQLEKSKNGMSISELFIFFRNRNKLIIWETLMLLHDLDYIVVRRSSGGLPIYFLSNAGSLKARHLKNIQVI